MAQPMTSNNTTSIPSEPTANAIASSHKNGETIHFDYTADAAQGDLVIPSASQNAPATSKKKKKNKKKNKTKVSASASVNVTSATITNPEDDYPISRVIKQGPDGSVVVESLPDNESEPSVRVNDSTCLGNPVHNMWFYNTTPEEIEKLKKFWDSLDTDTRESLAHIDKSEFLQVLRLDPKPSIHAPVKEKQDRDLHAFSSQNCNCANCGRKRDVIIAEVEHLYEENMENITEFLAKMSSLDDLPNLPDMLFEGKNSISDVPVLPTANSFEAAIRRQFDNASIESISKELESDPNVDLESSYRSFSSIFPGLEPSLALEFGAKLQRMAEIFEKGNVDQLTPDRREIALKEFSSFREFVREHKIAGNMDSFLKLARLTKLFDGMSSFFKPSAGAVNTKASDDPDAVFTKTLSNLTDDIFLNEGQGFIEMMDALSDSRETREFLSQSEPSAQDFAAIKSRMQKDAEDFRRKTQKQLDDKQPVDKGVSVSKEVKHELEEAFPEEDLYDDEDEDFEDEDDLDDQSSLDGSEISEEEKLQELRHLFLMQIIRLFRRGVIKAYKERQSQDQAQKLIEELEAEESAKKEKELKKLKQREKAKEKKRLQQLAKEEEKKRKEEELKAKEEEKKRREEQLKLDQRRRTEELLRKKEDEKMKRIEEQQKKLELQRVKEEAQKRLEELKRKEQQKRDEELKEKAKQEQERQTKERQLSNQREAERLAKQKEIESIAKQKAAEELRIQREAERLAMEIEEQQRSQELMDRKLAQEEPSRAGNDNQVSNGQSLGATNPLLQDLYPQSMSNTPKLDAWFPGTPPAQQPQLNQNFMFNNVALDPFNDPFTTAATPSLSNLTLNRNNANASTTTQPPGLTGGLGYSGVWNNSATKSRNNTIWNNTGSIWNSGGVNGTSSPNISNTNLNNLSSTNLNNLSATNLNNLSATNLNGTSGLPAPTTTNTDPHIIHSAAVQAFQMLSTSNSLEFGMAKGFTLFQATKNIVPQVSFNFNQFLGALTNTPSAYKFELIYDDFGTVNYIKVADATVNSPYQSSLNINLNGQGPSPTLTTPETTPFRVQNQLPNSQASQPNLSISLAASAAQYTPPRGFWN